MFVVLLIAATVFVTNMLVVNNAITDDVTWLKYYKRTIMPNGMVQLQPFDEVKNTFIMLHDYDMTAKEFSSKFSVVNENKIFSEPTKMVYL
jgi:hypothetical protein